jgi:hypothetical protein
MLHNRSDATATRLRLTVESRRGLSVPRRVRSLRPGQRRSVPAEVILGSRSGTSTTLRVKGTVADRVQAVDESTLYLSPDPRVPSRQ